MEKIPLNSIDHIPLNTIQSNQTFHPVKALVKRNIQNNTINIDGVKHRYSSIDEGNINVSLGFGDKNFEGNMSVNSMARGSSGSEFDKPTLAQSSVI